MALALALNIPAGQIETCSCYRYVLKTLLLINKHMTSPGNQNSSLKLVLSPLLSPHSSPESGPHLKYVVFIRISRASGYMI